MYDVYKLLYRRPIFQLTYLFWSLQSGDKSPEKKTLVSREKAEEEEEEGAMATPLNKLRILFCGVEFPGAVHHTQQFLKPYPHISIGVWPREEVADKIADYDMCVVRMMRLDSAVIARATSLKLIVQFGVGLEGVDIEAATRAGIKVAKIPSAGTGNALSCAEHSIYLILSLLRYQKEMAETFEAKRLGGPVGETLYGKTVLILGYGNIGKELANRLRPFGVKILAIRRSWTKKVNPLKGYRDGIDNGDQRIDEKGGIECLLEFASRADIIVICCVLNHETAGIVNRTFLREMKKGARLVNVARGGLLDYEAVKEALASGQLGGLAMDVAWSEPFDPSDPILQYPNVLITPHVAGVTELSYSNMGKIIAESAIQLSTGDPMPALEFVN
ncbi:unnamed protein product [Sphagnum compactum]